MKHSVARDRLDGWDKRGRTVFTLDDLAKIFHEEGRKTLQESVNRLRRQGVLEGVARGIYVYGYARTPATYRIEAIARTLRRGQYSYVSLESALSEYGIISQILVDRLTVMTTGRKGIVQTHYGTIEFTHTSRPWDQLMSRMRDVGRPLRMATPKAAWQDLKRVGRNTHLVDMQALNEAVQYRPPH